MHISCKPLWHTLIECNMRKEDLRLAAALTTNYDSQYGERKAYQHGYPHYAEVRTDEKSYSPEGEK